MIVSKIFPVWCIKDNRVVCFPITVSLVDSCIDNFKTEQEVVDDYCEDLELVRPRSSID